jgi:diguanylate cyclase (GGDEF)-like protein
MGYKDQTKGQLINELKDLRKRLSGLEETTDELTGLYNREYFLDLAECEFIRSRRFQRPLSVVLITVKDFYKIRSEHDKKIIDQILVEVANRCKLKVRDLDYFGRYDKDKFILLLPEADKSAIQKIAERLASAVSSSPISTEAGNLNITLCLGGAEIAESYPVLEEFLSKAEEALRSAEETEDSNIVIK